MSTTETEAIESDTMTIVESKAAHTDTPRRIIYAKQSIQSGERWLVYPLARNTGKIGLPDLCCTRKQADDLAKFWAAIAFPDSSVLVVHETEA